MVERSLLQSIREKELEASIDLDAARRGAAEVVEAARREAAGVLEEAAREAALSAEAYIRAETDQASREAGVGRVTELQRAEEAVAAEERRLGEAVERITRAVIPD